MTPPAGHKNQAFRGIRQWLHRQLTADDLSLIRSGLLARHPIDAVHSDCGVLPKPFSFKGYPFQVTSRGRIEGGVAR